MYFYFRYLALAVVTCTLIPLSEAGTRFDEQIENTQQTNRRILANIIANSNDPIQFSGLGLRFSSLSHVIDVILDTLVGSNTTIFSETNLKNHIRSTKIAERVIDTSLTGSPGITTIHLRGEIIRCALKKEDSQWFPFLSVGFYGSSLRS